MKKIAALSMLTVCILTACSKGEAVTEYSAETSVEKEADLEETIDSAKITENFGISILFPENPNWIKDIEYSRLEDNSMEIHYRDSTLEADCTFSAVRGDTLELPDREYDKNLDETWETSTLSEQRVYVKVQHSTDGESVLASWEYGNYKFAIWGNLSDGGMDSSAIAKTALYVVEHME